MALAGLLALSTLAPRAAGDEARTAAQGLFDDAVEAMKAHAYDRACPELEDVVRLLPGKVGAMMQLGLCYEEWGRIASAWSQYRAVASVAGPGDARGNEARTKVEALAPRVPKLTVAVAAANRATRGFAVTRDGRELLTSEWDGPLPVDPGKHEIAATAPGKKRWTGTVELAAGAAPVTVQIPELAGEGQPAAAGVLASATQGASTAVPRPDGSAPPASRPALAWALGGVGVAALGVAAGFGIDGLLAKQSIDARCHGLSPCPGLSASDASSLNGRKDRGLGVLIGAGAVGVATLAAGLVGLVGRAPVPRSSGFVLAPAVAPAFQGATLAGSF